MFHRFLRRIILTSMLMASMQGIWAQQCLDTYPVITGPDVVGVNVTTSVSYTTPSIPGHTYTWVVKQLPGLNVVGGSSSNILSQTWATPGDYRIELSEGIAGSSCTEVPASPMVVLAKPMLAAYFYYEFDAAHGCFYNEVTFTATGNGVFPPADPSISYTWYWGEYINPSTPVTWKTTNITSIGPNSSIVKILFPSTSGKTYATKLVVSKTISGRAWSDEITDFVFVDPDKYKPVAVVANPANPSCLYQPYNFSAFGSLPTSMATSETFLYVDWDFGDGTTQHFAKTGSTPPPLTTTHTYATPGLRTVTLTLTNTIHCSVTKTFTVDVPSTLPVALYTHTSPICLSNPVTFTNNSTVPAGLNIVKWEWTFGDGTPPVVISAPSSPNTVHVFPGMGPYIAQLKVTTLSGCQDSIRQNIKIDPSPLSDFTFLTTCLGDEVPFTDLSLPNDGPPISAWSWNFGDPTSPDNTSTERHPHHVFTSTGSFIVTLITTNTSGCVGSTKTRTVTVYPKPPVQFTQHVGSQNNEVYFQVDTSVTPIGMIGNMLLWNFGDGTFGNGGLTQSHIYAAGGTYIVTLTVTDTIGCSNSYSDANVVVPNLPEARFSSNSPVCFGQELCVKDLSVVPTPPFGYITTWIWNWGDISPNDTVFFPNNPNLCHLYATADTFAITLKVIDDKGYIDNVITNIIVLPNPKANFFYSTACQDKVIQFTDMSSPNGSGNIISWIWNFADPGSAINNNSTLTDPTHIFSHGDSTYMVRLIVKNFNNCIDTIVKPVYVFPAPPVAFTHDTACLNELVHFLADTAVTHLDSIVHWSWDFGDGTPPVTDPGSTAHPYSVAGIHLVTLTVIDHHGCSNTVQDSIMINPLPVSNFSWGTPVCQGTQIQFTDHSFVPPGFAGYIAKWQWDFGDGTSQTIIFPNPQNVSHTYAGTGPNYTVRLTVWTNDSCTAFIKKTLILIPAPVANFEFPATRCEDQQVQFTDISQPNGGGDLVQWSWNFGDPLSGSNNTSLLPSPVHIFSTAGNDTVRLIVANANGCRDTTYKVVSISAAPFAFFAADTACVASLTYFSDSSTTPTPGTITSWAWSFGDPASGTNNTSTLQNPVHTFNSPGTYPVSLHVTNSHQCPKDTVIQVVVNPKPTAMFQYSSVCVNDSTQFTDLTISPGSQIRSWLWDFGCGNATCISTKQNPKYLYANPGNYSVKLVVTNQSGCSDSVTIQVVARSIPRAKFSYLSFFCPAGKVNFQDLSTATASSIAQREWIFEPGSTSSLPNPSYIYPVTTAMTSYPVTLIVTDTYGCRDTVLDSLVYVKPGFTFSFRNDSVCQGYTTHFDTIHVTPGDHLYNVSWNFGDPSSVPNNTSTLMSPSHQFTGPGVYVVKLKAINSDNCVDSVYREVPIYEAPKPNYGFVSNPCDSVVYFSDLTANTGNGSIVSWKWIWGDGGDTTILAPGPGNKSHLYVNAGVYQVTLIITNINGCVDSITQSVQRFPCIKAGFTYKDTLCARYKIAFADSSLPVSRINQWHWTWGDGTDTTYTVHNSPIMHTFASGGTFNVNLEVQALLNGTTISENMMSAVVIHPTPMPYFSNPPVCLKQVTLFTDTSKTYGEQTVNWNWTFSQFPTDTSTFRNPTHLYDSSGTYNVKLIVMNKYGCKDSLIKPTRVYGLPVAGFENTAACAGEPTLFFDRSIKADTAVGFWRWTFGDPATIKDTSQLKDPTYRYLSAGDFSVRMIVKDNFGCIDTLDSTVKVNITPMSSFTIVDAYNGRPGQVKLNNISTGATLYNWDFGNGKTSEETSPVVTYEYSLDSLGRQNYIIKLISLNQYDCSDTTFYRYSLLFKGLYVPNAFAPSNNNLGVRLFKPTGINLKQYHVTVFDMWGHLMWESTKLDEFGTPTEGWDGTFEGATMPQGNYMWRISALFIDGAPWEGSDIGSGASAKTMGTVSLIQ